MTGLGTGFRETQEESSFLSRAAGDAGLSLHRTPPGFLFLFTPLPRSIWRHGGQAASPPCPEGWSEFSGS